MKYADKLFYALSIGTAIFLPFTSHAQNLPAPVPMTLTSSAFAEGGIIPPLYTCIGQNISPALYWSGVPAGTQSFAVVMEDPDTARGTFTHWIAYNISPQLTTLNPRIPAEGNPGMLLQAQNDSGSIGYTGPCPTADSGVHRYHFYIYAMDTVLNLPPDTYKEAFKGAIEGHVLGVGRLTGTFQIMRQSSL